MNTRLLSILLLCFFTQAAEAQFQNSTNGSVYNLGNVAIGSNYTGQAKLTVSTSQSNDGIWLGGPGSNIALLIGGTAGAWTPLTQPGDQSLMWKRNAPDDASAGGLIIGPWSNNMTGMRIDASGHVSIGTSNAQNYMLAVNGSAIFTKVVVKQYGSWPDYVFHPAYQLLPLDSLNKYVQTNHHLPDVPSADSVAKNGVDLGDNQAQLLKKIEELTLYIIDQNKTIKDMQAKVEKLEKAISK